MALNPSSLPPVVRTQSVLKFGARTDDTGHSSDGCCHVALYSAGALEKIYLKAKSN